MPMLRIELQNEAGETIVYRQNKVMGRKVREALEIQKLVKQEDLEVLDQLDLMVGFVAGLFDEPKVTEDAIWYGIDSDKILDVVQGIVGDVMGTEDDAGGKLSPPKML